MSVAKGTVTFIVLIVMVMPDVYSQDVIIFQDGEEIEVKVVEIGTNEIKYKKWPPSGEAPIYVEIKENIFMIKYDDGTKDIFKARTTPIAAINNVDPLKISTIDACIAGDKDAREYHRGGGNFLLGLGFGIFGIIGVAATNNPKGPDLARIPEPRLARNPDYLSCYKKKAHKSNIGLTVAGTLTAAVIILLTTQQ